MFSRFVKYDSHQFAVAKGSHDLLKFIVQVKRTYFFLRGQRRLFDKETFFRVEKTVLAYFSWYYLRCCWKHNYLKKAIFPVETFFWPSYLVLWSNKVEKPQWTIYNRLFCFLTFFVQYITSFGCHLWSRWEFFSKMLYCWWFWSVFSRITEYTSGRNSWGSK